MQTPNLLHLANIAIVITTLFTAMLPGSAVAQETPQQPQGAPSEAGDAPVAAPQEVVPPVVETTPVTEQVPPVIDSATPTPAVETPPPLDATEPPPVQQAEQPNAPRRPVICYGKFWNDIIHDANITDYMHSDGWGDLHFSASPEAILAALKTHA